MISVIFGPTNLENFYVTHQTPTLSRERFCLSYRWMDGHNFAKIMITYLAEPWWVNKIGTTMDNAIENITKSGS